MTKIRTIAAALLLGIAPFALLLPATNANAASAGVCTLKVPAKVAVSSPYRAITLGLSGCTAEWAAWDAYHPTKGWEDIAYIEPPTADIWDLYDWVDLGRWTWRPSGAYDANSNELPQNTPYTDIRMASWARVTPVRSGAKVTLNVSVARYAHTLDKFVPWAGAFGQLQYKAPGATKWIALKSFTATSTGKYSYAYTSAAVRDYRVYFPASNVIWQVGSPTVRK